MMTLNGVLPELTPGVRTNGDRKSTRLNSSHDQTSYAVFCLKKKQRSLDPGADLSKMVPRLTSTLPPGTITGAAPPTQYASRRPIQAASNPTPPVKTAVTQAS